MENDESRKIFYFLMVNLAYMVIQLLWGFWTNSLGLVSDAIHMFFDCLSVGVGLMASVMANWPPNESFTYGYGRIETISGFANGIFLILISIFIAFEAVQRIIDPPEMGNFKQLLIVSTLGLAVNLFGMAIRTLIRTPIRTRMHRNPSPAARIILMDMITAIRTKNTIMATLTTGTGHLRSAVTAATVIATMGTGTVILMMTMTTVTTTMPTNCIRTDTTRTITRTRIHTRTPAAGRKVVHPRSTLINLPQAHRQHPMASIHRSRHRIGSNTMPISTRSILSSNINMMTMIMGIDTLGSVGVIISTILIELYGWTGFDPIASLFIAVLIAASVIPLVIDCGKVLCLDIGEKEVDVRDALHELSNVDGVASYSEARFWPKDSSSVVGSIHVRLTPSASSYDPTGPHSVKKTSYTNVDRVIDRVDRLLKSKIPGLDDLSIQVEGS
ncbi:putative zinc transporter msc2 [Tulasnella sp. 408]|nr:putative zinc transporter msc2 [Tulasnella sp. 408]